MGKNKKYCDVKTGADKLDVTPHYVRKLLREGKLGGDKKGKGGQWRVDLESLAHYMGTDEFKNDLKMLEKKGVQISIKEAVENVEDYFGSDLVSYVSLSGTPVSMIDMNDCIQLDELLGNMTPKVKGGNKKFKKIILFLHSGGGLLESAIKFVDIIMQYAEEFEVIVPFLAKSASTVICLKASELHLTTLSELGPVDPIIQSPTNPGLKIPATAIDNFIEYYGSSRIKDTDVNSGDQVIAEKLEKAVDPYLLGTYKQSLKFSTEVIENALENYAMKGESEEKLKAAVDEFTVKHSSHNYPITYNILKEYGIGQKIQDKNKLKNVKLLLNVYLQFMRNGSIVKLIGNRDENKNIVIRNRQADSKQIPSHTSV